MLSMGGPRIDIRTATGKLMLTMLGAIAAFERGLMIERPSARDRKGQGGREVPGPCADSAAEGDRGAPDACAGLSSDRDRPTARDQPGERLSNREREWSGPADRLTGAGPASGCFYRRRRG